MFEEDDDSSLDNNTLHTGTEHHSPVEHSMAPCLTSIEEEEYLPRAPLNDDIWVEEPVPDRHLCIHEHSQHNLYPYPCSYILDQLHFALVYALQYMDLSDIFDFWDVITTASHENIPNQKIFSNFKYRQ